MSRLLLGELMNVFPAYTIFGEKAPTDPLSLTTQFKGDYVFPTPCLQLVLSLTCICFFYDTYHDFQFTYIHMHIYIQIYRVYIHIRICLSLSCLFLKEYKFLEDRDFSVLVTVVL